MLTPTLQALAGRLGWTFNDDSLLVRSLAHRSWCAEHGEESNERLEFLGDAVLGLVVTSHIFRSYPHHPEGDLAKMRASLVNAIVLAEVATDLDVGPSLLLGKGEAATGGRAKTSILSDALEALIGAVYIDGGWDPAAALVMRLLSERIEESAMGPGGNDYKTRLQELVARRFDQLPSYRVTDVGPDHAKEFHAVVMVLGRVRGSGDGRSKKAAEQAAARIAWEEITADLATAGSGAGPGGGPGGGSTADRALLRSGPGAKEGVL